MSIDGYTQGAFTSDPSDDAKSNTLAKGTNAALKIELDGENAGFGAAGLLIETSNSVIKGLVINRFSSAGILIAGPVNSIEGNFIGTDPSGTTALGNGFSGVDVEGFLGDAADNTTIGGITLESRNLISANTGSGVSFLGNLAGTNSVLGNLIGTKKDGITALGNSSGGVGIFGASSISVGELDCGGANTIAFNGLGGVVVGNSGSTTTTSNSMGCNSTFSNAGLGTDLGNDGPTPNDVGDKDSGPNTLQNKPVLSSAKAVSSKTTIKGKLNSTPNLSYFVLFYSNPKGNEGKKFIGAKLVSTDGSGKISFTFKPKKKVAVGQKTTATATGPDGTSEFSAVKKVVASS